MILYQIKCKDLGFDYCNFIATGNSETELKRKFFFHAIINHDKDLDQMAETQKIELNCNMNRLIENQN
jgi:predicted small metal-binding protein